MTTARRWRQVYEHIAPVLVIFCLIASLFASAGTYLLNVANGKQDAVRVTENRALLTCVSDWADAFTGTLPPIREATIAKDEALREAMGTFRSALVNAKKNATASDKKRQAILDGIVDAFSDYEDAADALAQARKDNPYPPAPKFACKSFLDDANSK